MASDLLYTRGVFAGDRFRAASILALATTLGCGAEAPQLFEAGLPAGWFDSDREWYLGVSVVAPPGETGPAASLSGLHAPLERVSFEVAADRLFVSNDDGRLFAALATETGSGALVVDFGSNDVPVDVGPLFDVRPLPHVASPFVESAAFEGHRAARDYIEWTTPAAVRLGHDVADELGFEPDLTVWLRYSMRPLAAEPDSRLRSKFDELDRFGFDAVGALPRLAFVDERVPWSDRQVEPVVLELAPDVPANAVVALEEAVRRISAELEGAFEERGAAVPEDALQIRPSGCSVAALAPLFRDDPELAARVEARACASEPCIGLEEPDPVTLEALCRAAEAETWDHETGRGSIHWARTGDLRHHRVGILPAGGPFAISVGSFVERSSGRIVRLQVDADFTTPIAQAERTAHWTERLLASRGSPSSTSLLRAVQAANQRFEVGLTSFASNAFASRLETRLARATTTLPSADAQRIRLSSAGAASRALGRPVSATIEERRDWHDGRQVRAKFRSDWLAAGRLVDDRGTVGALTLATRVGTAGPEEAERRTRERLFRHRWLKALLLGLGVRPNYAASTDPLNLDPTHRLTASVTDPLPLALRTEQVDLGPYDRAALRFGYADLVLTFDHDVPERAKVAAFIEAHGPVGLLDFLCRDTCSTPQEALERISQRSYVEAESALHTREVPFVHCTPEAAFGGRTWGCEAGDWGVLPHWSAAYDVYSFRTEGWLDDPRPPWDRALLRGRLASQTLHARSQEGEDSSPDRMPDAFRDPIGRSLASAAAIVLNLVLEVAVRPDPEGYCRDYDALTRCDQEVDVWVGEPFGRFRERDELLQSAIVDLTLDDAAPGHPAELFTPELRELASLAVRGVPSRAPAWCPDEFGSLARGWLSAPGLVDPVTGDASPPSDCLRPLTMPMSERFGAVEPLTTLLATVGVEREPSLGVWMGDGDCAVRLNGDTFASTLVDDPWVSGGCHVLAALSEQTDASRARAEAAFAAAVTTSIDP